MKEGWIWIIVIIAMFILGMAGVGFDKNDWIFLVLVVGIIMISIKLNKILSLLEKKKK